MKSDLFENTVPFDEQVKSREIFREQTFCSLVLFLKPILASVTELFCFLVPKPQFKKKKKNLFKTSCIFKKKKSGVVLLLRAKEIFQDPLASRTLTNSLVSSHNEEMSCREYWTGQREWAWDSQGCNTAAGKQNCQCCYLPQGSPKSWLYSLTFSGFRYNLEQGGMHKPLGEVSHFSPQIQFLSAYMACSESWSYRISSVKPQWCGLSVSCDQY